MNLLYLILGLGLILGGANFLTDGASAIAKRFRIPEFIIGLTIIAVGTSTPELVVSLLSAIAGQSDMAVGNVVGSNLFNGLVILGICALIRPLALSGEALKRDIPICFGASVLLLGLTAFGAGRISRIEGLLMAGVYIGLIVYTVRTARRGHTLTKEESTKTESTKLWHAGLMILGGLAGLVFGGELFLRSATATARTLGMSESVIAITLVAGGTSLPELAASVVSLVKGKAEMALGNVVGSNIANILLVLGISASVHPLSLGGITQLDMEMVALSALLLFIAAFTFRRRMLDRWEGAFFLILYGGYIWYLIR